MANNKVYVGNLPYQTEEDDLRTEFSSCGEIEDVNIIMDRDTGRSKGFAFITFVSPDSLSAALEKNETEFQGRTIRVNQAEDRKKIENNDQFLG